ncbi:MAG: cytochrome C, partial [Betaproteobacteria bacterium]|nr:cytochrome C [Betaproteobacteria bacterium]
MSSLSGKIVRTIRALSVLLAAAVISTPSEATPAFARQMGKACVTCHFQHYPALNTYG